MQYSIIDMSLCPLHRRIAAAFLMFATFALPAVASASDASIPYRNFPGFRCNQRNVRKECVDWSYFDDTGSRVRYGATSPVQPRKSIPTVQCGNANVNCTGTVTVRANASPKTVARDGVITYSLYVRNDDSQQRSVNLQAFIDDDVLFENATYGGYHDGGGLIRWDTMRMPARTARTMTLRVRVRSNASTANPIQLRVQTDRSTDTVFVNVQDSGFYSNNMKVTNDGITVRYNRYSGTQYLQTHPTYFHDEYRSIHRYNYEPSSTGSGYSCDSTRFSCQ